MVGLAQVGDQAQRWGVEKWKDTMVPVLSQLSLERPICKSSCLLEKEIQDADSKCATFENCLFSEAKANSWCKMMQNIKVMKKSCM